MKYIAVQASNTVTINVADVLNQIEKDCIPPNVHLDSHGLYQLEEPNGKKLDVDFPPERAKQIKDILIGITAIKKFYGI